MPITNAVSHNAITVTTTKETISDFSDASDIGESPYGYHFYCTGNNCKIWINGTIGPIELVADAAPHPFHALVARIKTIEAQAVGGDSTLTAHPVAS